MSAIRYVNGDPSIGQDLPDTQTCAKGDPWGHTADCPWLTIQFGVDQLAKIGGGILSVAPNQYTENVVMDGQAYSHISIVGEVAGLVTASVEIAVPRVDFCGARPRLVAKDPKKPTILIKGGANDVRLEDLSITGGHHGIDATQVRKLHVITCCIRDNTALAEGGGGFVFVDCRDVLVRGCVVFGNAATGPNVVGGGGAMTHCQTIAVEDCHFYANRAVLAGGALRVEHCPAQSRVVIEGNVFGNPWPAGVPGHAFGPLFANTADFGGGISIDYCQGVDVRIGMLKANRHSGNAARVSGGAIAIEVSDCKIGQDQFVENTADKHGGALFVHNGFTVRLAGSHLEGNRAAQGCGGAIYADSELSAGAMTLSAVTLKDNQAPATGGFGGGLYAAFNVKVAVLSNTRFVGNQAEAGGGLFYTGSVTERRLEIVGSRFEANSADGSGGGAHVIDADATIRDDTRFSDNVAADAGGGLCFKGSGLTGPKLTLDRCSFLTNHAGRGGGAFIEETLAGVIENNRVLKNEGGLYFLKDKMGALGFKANLLKDNVTQGGADEEIVSEGDVGTPKLDALDLVAANSVSSTGVIVR